MVLKMPQACKVFVYIKINVKDVVRIDCDSLVYGFHYLLVDVLNYVIMRQLGVMSVSDDLVGVQFEIRQ